MKHYLVDLQKGGIKKNQKESSNSKQIYYVRKFDSYKFDAKSTWKVTNNLLRIKQEKLIVNKELDTSNLFNDHFAIIGMNLNDGINISTIEPLSYTGVIHVNIFLFRMADTDSDDSPKLIRSLKNKNTLNLNNDEFKLTQFVPLHKSGNKNFSE